MTGKAVVLGAGAIGVASAHYLQRDGWDVTVVDRGEIGRGCSYGNCCLIVPSHSDPLPGPGVIGQALIFMLSRTSPFYFRPRFDPALFAWSWKFRKYCNRKAAAHGFAALMGLSRGSLALHRELLAGKESEFFFEQRGLLEVCLTEKGLAQAREEQDTLLRHGFSATILSADEVIAREPAVRSTVAGGRFVQGEAHGFSYGYVESLARNVQARGGHFLTGRAVTRVLLDGARVRGVALDRPGEELPADLVVIAAGAWSKGIAATVGLDIPLQPAKGYSATIDTFAGAPSVPILVKERRVIVTPLDGRVRFGGTLELTGFDATINKTRYGAVVGAARAVLNVDFPMANEEAWCGFRPVTPDGLPIIDRVPDIDGLIVATGHAMLGFTQSPMTGKLVAELAAGAQPSLPIEPFRLARF